MAPRTAIQAPVGAMDRHKPSTRCEKLVQRFVNEYRRILPSATGASNSVRRFNMAAAKKKRAAKQSVKIQTKPEESSPEGRALIEVRGFSASNRRSTRR